MKTKAFGIFVMAWLLFAIAPSASARDIQKAKFFNTTPFGSLAWVHRANTRAFAKSLQKVKDLSPYDCSELPQRQVHWFVVNHLSQEQTGFVGYFSIRIIYESENPQDVLARGGIHLHRNANWYDPDGRKISREFERKPHHSSLDVHTFLQLHEAVDEAADGALANLEKLIGRWHMRVDLEGARSWDDRNLYTLPIKAALNDKATGVSARLLRFTATSNASSQDPVLFWLDAENATAATIIVDAPNLSSDGARSSYRVVFGGSCDP